MTSLTKTQLYPPNGDKNRLPRILLLGIGNLLWADEGFGVRTIEFLKRHYIFPEHVRLLDGGTQGIYLVQDIRETDVLVVFDAIDYGLPGGSLKVVHGDEVPKFLGCKKISLHQTGFQEVLAMAEMLGDYPSEILLIGVQPLVLEDYGGSLQPAVKAQIEPAIEVALEFLAQFGIEALRRQKPLAAELGAGSIADIDRYEADRPTEQQACRAGDERVLLSPGVEVGNRAHPVDGLSVSLDQHLNTYRDGER